MMALLRLLLTFVIICLEESIKNELHELHGFESHHIELLMHIYELLKYDLHYEEVLREYPNQ